MSPLETPPQREPVPQRDPAKAGRLFVVATPIGNLADLSLRAREVLATVELVLAEDTRRIRILLNHFGIATRAAALYEHNEARRVPELLVRLQLGARLALVSDAGTPLVSDPGYRLVRACRQAAIAVEVVPGPSAVTAALSVAGLPAVPFTFAGFLPPTAVGRRNALAALAAVSHTLVLFLAPHRLAAELEACAEVLGGQRDAALLAELSKVHERCVRGTLAELAQNCEVVPRGEFTLVVGPAAEASAIVTREAAEAALNAALQRGCSLPEARRAAARQLGIPRRQLYDLLSRPQR